MADTDSASATVLPPNPAPLAPRKQHAAPIGSKIAELNESRTELHTRIQGLKQLHFCISGLAKLEIKVGYSSQNLP
ncbi:hypothetical protein LINPERHAP1_LOCUS1578 [Linum perenne]